VAVSVWLGFLAIGVFLCLTKRNYLAAA
jgi:hypothetical protein